MGVSSFSLAAYRRGGVVVLRFAGEYDLMNAPAVDQRLAELERADPPVLVLDLHRVSFIDSTALGRLVGAAKRAKQRARRLVVVRPAGPAGSVFELTLLDRAFEMVDELQDVFDRLPPSPDATGNS